MMTDYIKRDALLEARELAICAYENAGIFNADAIRNHLKPLLDAVVDTPAADVADVVHGEWLRSDDDWNSLTTIQCSLCSEEWCFETDDDVSLLNYKYCPNCGAKMDGGFDDGKRCD